jgi:hypothetical protein
METEARLIKALRDKKLLQSDDTIKAARMSSEELLSLNGQVLVLIKRKKRRKKKEESTISFAPESISHFTFSDGKNSFMFVSRDKDRVGAIADFIIDFVDVEEEEPC